MNVDLMLFFNWFLAMVAHIMSDHLFHAFGNEYRGSFGTNSLSLSGIVLRHTGVDSEHVTGGFRARTNCERVSNICVLKSVILVINVDNY